MDNRLRRVFGTKLDAMSEAEIAAASAVLEFERKVGPIYRKPYSYPVRETKQAMNDTIREGYGITMQDVMRAGRKRTFVYLRFAATIIFGDLTGLSDAEVMEALGSSRNRTNLVYARSKAKDLMLYADFKDMYDALLKGTLEKLEQWNIQLR